MFSNWSEHWQAPDTRLQSIKAALEAQDATVFTGGDYDRWDLEVRGGMLGAVRILMAVEEYGLGRQLVRFRSWPRCAPGGLVLTLLSAALATGATRDRAWAVAAILGGVTVTIALRMFQECAAATAAAMHALQGSVRTRVAALSWLEHRLGFLVRTKFTKWSNLHSFMAKTGGHGFSRAPGFSLL